MEETTPTVWQVISPSNRDMMMAVPGMGLAIPFIYGCYKFYEFGVGSEHYLYTYVPTVGGFLAIVGVIAYGGITTRERRGVIPFLGAISGWFPYLMSLFMMGFLGLYHSWLSVDALTVWSIVKGLFWIYLGYKVLRKFWVITELARLRVEGDVGEVLIRKLRMGKRDLRYVLQDEQALEAIAAVSASSD